jgi:hypothetical protein
MLPRQNRRFWALPLVVLLVGCAPKIGNKCTLSTDCSQLGDRLCDATQPDGYCTIFNCEPDTCPEAACVAFKAQLDPACEATDVSRTPRFERTFCMKVCSQDSDCRDGYRCAAPGPDDGKFRIVDLVNNPPEQKICLAASTGDQDAGTPMDSGTPPQVCGPGNASDTWTPYAPDGGMGGAGGHGGMGGAGGNGGMGGMGGADGGP